MLTLQRQNGDYYGKYAWKAFVVDGKIEEYKRRHNEIWPKMVEVLKNAGITNYTVWTSGNEL